MLTKIPSFTNGKAIYIDLEDVSIVKPPDVIFKDGRTVRSDLYSEQEWDKIINEQNIDNV